ncbi:MAG: hypothetical protein QNJ55_31560 [Xenococcus sp. MO_188.B8]|nr:hypothetical protein [Xenococcus sp. MO_188.B8]
MSKSYRGRINKRNTKIQVSFNDFELLDVQVIEETEGVKIQEFIRTLIKDRAKLLRQGKLEQIE